MIVPSKDWKEVLPLHTHMAVFRAIENGFSLIRGTGHGLSIAVDYQGRELIGIFLLIKIETIVSKFLLGGWVPS